MRPLPWLNPCAQEASESALELISLKCRSMWYAKYRMIANFATSEGWNVTGPSEIQRWKSSNPAGGDTRRTATSRANETSRMGIAAPFRM